MFNKQLTINMSNWENEDYLAWIATGCPVVTTVVALVLQGIRSMSSKIDNLPNLQELYYYSSDGTTIPSTIGALHNLRTLYLANNRLETIPSEIGNLNNLETLDLSENLLTTIPAEIGNIQNISNLSISGNPIEYIPPNIRRLFIRQKHAQGVYIDAQSVHNSTVQQTIKDSILRLISIPPTIESDKVLSYILTDSTLTDFTKQSIVEYTQNTDLISELNVSFLDVLTAVWNRIVNNEYSTDIKKVLNCEMEDSKCKCFTGRVSRLVNCLSGFDSLVEVKIADNEQIGNVIAVVGDRLIAERRYTTNLHKEIANTELKELGYSDDVIDAWINYIE